MPVLTLSASSHWIDKVIDIPMWQVRMCPTTVCSQHEIAVAPKTLQVPSGQAHCVGQRLGPELAGIGSDLADCMFTASEGSRGLREGSSSLTVGRAGAALAVAACEASFSIGSALGSTSAPSDAYSTCASESFRAMLFCKRSFCMLAICMS